MSASVKVWVRACNKRDEGYVIEPNECQTGGNQCNQIFTNQVIVELYNHTEGSS
jgi:hypothetical protein